MSAAADGRKWAKGAEAAAEAARSARAIATAKRAAAQEKQVAHATRVELERVEAALSVALDLGHALPPRPIRGSPSRGIKQACPVFVASDWHVEEKVKAEAVNGLNEYGPSVARKRAERWVDGCLWLLETHRAGATINEAVLALLGDFITGFLHEESPVGNALLPTEAVLLAQELVGDAIVTLLARGKFKGLRVVCTRGNHGRVTRRTWINVAARYSYEWLMYRALAQRFEKDPRVTFTVEDGYHTYVPVYDKVLRFHHGDAFKYEGGIGGITVPLTKAIARWNRARRADLDLMGHWHTLCYGGPFVVNGSLIGWNGYAAWIGASPEPPQQAFVLIRPDRGVSAFAPVFAT